MTDKDIRSLSEALILDDRLAQLEKQYNQIKDILEEHAKERAKLQVDVTQVADILNEVKFGFKFMVRLAQLIKWFAATLVAVIAIWSIMNSLHTGKFPSLKDLSLGE